MLNVQHTTSHKNHTNVLRQFSSFVKTTQKSVLLWWSSSFRRSISQIKAHFHLVSVFALWSRKQMGECISMTHPHQVHIERSKYSKLRSVWISLYKISVVQQLVKFTESKNLFRTWQTIVNWLSTWTPWACDDGGSLSYGEDTSLYLSCQWYMYNDKMKRHHIKNTSVLQTCHPQISVYLGRSCRVSCNAWVSSTVTWHGIENL